MAVHGYHPYAEDAEIYLPGVEKVLQPGLFPVGIEFFESHASLTLFPYLIAASVRLTHLPFDYALFAWYLLSIFLLLLATWNLSGKCFASASARWGSVLMMVSLLTLPVAGTALYILDQYTNPRNLAAALGLFAISQVLDGKFVRTAVVLVIALAIHPLMGSFAVALALLLWAAERLEKLDRRLPVAAAFLPLTTLFAPPTPAYHEAMKFHVSHFILQWQWYEWLGALAPMAIFWRIGRMARGQNRLNLTRLCRALVVYNSVYFAAVLVISTPKRFESLARIQPLRSLHLTYMLLILIGGGLIAEYILKGRIWRWAALFLPLCAGMFFAQRQLFPASPQIEWPWAAAKNPWAQAFLWVRQNTSTGAVVALDPDYMGIAGEDNIGFRALAQRSRLADLHKDSGAVSMFPPLAEEWWEQVQDEKNWKQFTASDFERLAQKYSLTWVIVQAPGVAGLPCPYQNSVVAVCRVGQGL